MDSYDSGVVVPSFPEAQLPPPTPNGVLVQVLDGTNAGKLLISYNGNWEVVA